MVTKFEHWLLLILILALIFLLNKVETFGWWFKAHTVNTRSNEVHKRLLVLFILLEGFILIPILIDVFFGFIRVYIASILNLHVPHAGS